MEINYPSGKDHWKKFEKNDPPIALNVLYVRIKKNTYPAYISKYNTHQENQIILLMIPNGEGRHYLSVKS